MQDQFDLFLKEKKYLKGVAPKTLVYYQHCWQAFKRYKGEVSEMGLKTFVLNMREANVSPGAVNTFSRGINSFLSWLHENHLTETHLKIKQLKTEKRVLKTYTEKQAKELVHYKPKKFWEKRVHTMILFLIDTGCRIDEAITLERKKVDLENLLVTVYGKGRKERIIPISRECRGTLYRYLNTHKFELVFPTKDGLALTYRNIQRDLMRLLENAGSKRQRVVFTPSGGSSPKATSKVGQSVLPDETARAHFHPNEQTVCGGGYGGTTGRPS